MGRKERTSEKALKAIGIVIDVYRKAAHEETHEKIEKERDYWKRIYYELKEEHDKLVAGLPEPPLQSCDYDSQLCRCGHPHSDHAVIDSHNYTAGACQVDGGKDGCEHFLIATEKEHAMDVEFLAPRPNLSAKQEAAVRLMEGLRMSDLE